MNPSIHPGRRPRDFKLERHSGQNPLFRARPGRSSLVWFLVLLILLAAFVIWGIASPRFRITQTIIYGTVKLEPSSLATFVDRRLDQSFLGVRWRRVRFLTPRAAIGRELRQAIERLVLVDRVTLALEGNHRLSVTVVERTPSVVWLTTARTAYQLDDDGRLADRVPGELPADVPQLQDVNNLVVQSGSRVTVPRFVAAVRELHARLPSLGIPVAGFTTWRVSCLPDAPNPTETTPPSTAEGENRNLIPPGSSPCDLAALVAAEPTMVVETTEGWTIRFDTSVALDAQLEKLTRVLRERPDVCRQAGGYIDVRFGNRVFCS